jgi:hypothetical protein
VLLGLILACASRARLGLRVLLPGCALRFLAGQFLLRQGAFAPFGLPHVRAANLAASRRSVSRRCSSLRVLRAASAALAAMIFDKRSTSFGQALFVTLQLADFAPLRG